MQDVEEHADSSVPGISRAPLVGKAFQSRSKVYSKTELVIFLRPVVIRNPSIDADLRMYKTFLERPPVAPSDKSGGYAP